MRVGVTLRYQKTASGDANVYIACIGKLYAMAISAVQAWPVIESIRLRRITVRSPGLTNTGAGGFLTFPAAIGLRLDDGAIAPFGQERRYSDVPTTTRGAMVSAKMSGLNAMWIDCSYCVLAAAQGQRVFVLTAPTGTIVDLKVTMQFMVNKAQNIGNVLVGVGMTTGVVYNNFLDNTNNTNAAGTQQLQYIGGTNVTAMV